MQIHFLLSLYFSPFSYSLLQEFVENDQRSITDSFSLFQFFLILFTSFQERRSTATSLKKADSFFSLPLFFFIFLIYFFKHSWKADRRSIKDSFSSRFFLFTSSRTRAKPINNRFIFFIPSFSPSCSHVHFSRTKINESRLIFFLPPPNFSYSRTRGNRRSTSRERRTLV